MEKIDENIKQELIQKALSIYKDGDIINQKFAYDGAGNKYQLTHVNIDTIKVDWYSSSKTFLNVIINGKGVYNTKYNIWAKIESRVTSEELLLTNIL